MKKEADIANQPAELQDKARFILRFITESETEGRVIWDEFERVIDVAYAKGDARGLKEILREFTQWARSLPNDRRKQLDALLDTEFGSTIEDLYKPIRNKINQVLERGAIRTPAEYRMLEERASEIFDDAASKAELDRLNELLVVFSTQSDLRDPGERGRTGSTAAAAPHAGKALPARTLSLPRRLADACGRQTPGAQMRRAVRLGDADHRAGSRHAGIAGRAFQLRPATACSASRRPPTPLARECACREDLTKSNQAASRTSRCTGC